MERLIRLDPGSVPERRRLGLILVNIAEVQKRLGKVDQATSLLEQVVAIESALASEDPQSLDPLIALAKANSDLGRILGELPAELFPAMAAFERAVEIREAVIRSHAGLPEQSCQLASDLQALSALQQKADKSESAFQNLARALEILNRIDQQYPGIATYKTGVGTSCNMMSNLQRRRGEYTEALGFAQKAALCLRTARRGVPRGCLLPARARPKSFEFWPVVCTSRSIRRRAALIPARHQLLRKPIGDRSAR